jgi:GABA(A) receptor-associated protein
MLRINTVLNSAIKGTFTPENYYVNMNKTFQERLEESHKIKNKYPDRVPVICEKNPGSGLDMLDKRKYLVPNDLTATQFLFIIRKRLKLASEKGIFLFVNNMIAPSTNTMIELYNQYKDDDGFLYMNYTEENVFG